MIVDIYSKRRKRLEGEIADVYQYAVIPVNLRVQIWQIITAALENSNSEEREVFETVHRILLEEYGLFQLSNRSQWSPMTDLQQFLINESRTDEALDITELCMKIIHTYVRDNSQRFSHATLSPDNAISDLNHRFKEHGVGFQFEAGFIVKIEDELLHDEVVRPLIATLDKAPFKAALEEFHSAHKHYRHQHYKECLVDCLKAFESTMKAICNEYSWPIDENATANKLITALFDNSFFPSYMESQISALRTLLSSGVPTVRNKNAGHGQGTIIQQVPEELASYCLHLTATNLLFMVKTFEQNKPEE